MTPEERIEQVKEHQEQLKKQGYSSLFTAGKLDSSHESYAVHCGQVKYVTPTDMGYVSAGMTDAAALEMEKQSITYHLGAMQEVILKSFIKERANTGDQEAMSHYFKLSIIAMANYLATAQRSPLRSKIWSSYLEIGMLGQ